ncbi:transposase [Streptomyces misionensis]|uniref:transposase n=1 Tax=Streptomyces misionensis TaxID=67331 RepID=UPI0038082C84
MRPVSLLDQPPGGHRRRLPLGRRRRPARAGQSQRMCDWKQEHNHSHKQVRARVEHVFARMKTWKILRDCSLKGNGVHTAMLGIAHLHNLLQPV